MSRRGPPPDTSRMVSLKVDGLTHRTCLEDLESLFEKYGKVGDVYIPKDYRTKENRGFGFVRYFHKHDAEDAIESLDGRKFDGRELSVQYARYDRPERDYNRAPGGGGGGRSSGRRRSRSRSRSRGDRGSRRDRSRSRDRRRDRDRSRSRDRGSGRDRDRSKSRDHKRSRSSRSRSESEDDRRGSDRKSDKDRRRRRSSGHSDDQSDD